MFKRGYKEVKVLFIFAALRREEKETRERRGKKVTRKKMRKGLRLRGGRRLRVWYMDDSLLLRREEDKRVREWMRET